MVTGISLEKAPPTGERGADGPAWEEVQRAAERARLLAEEFRRLESADAAAFGAYLAALRLPRTTAEESVRRRQRLVDAAAHATEVPLETLEASLGVLDLVAALLEVAARARLRAQSDLGGAVELAYAAFRAAELNVRVNLPALDGDSRQPQLRQRWLDLQRRASRAYVDLRRRIAAWLDGRGGSVAGKGNSGSLESRG
jgi:formiminotetrahydrofolate cyclodeaminase